MHTLKSNLNFQDKTRNIHYINSVGAIIDNSLMLYLNDNSLININEIRKVEIYKTRRLIFNVFFILWTLPLFYFLLKYELTILEKVLTGVLIAISLVFAYFMEDSNYVMLIRKLDLNFIEIKLSKNFKEDAKKISRIVNAKIKRFKQ